MSDINSGPLCVVTIHSFATPTSQATTKVAAAFALLVFLYLFPLQASAQRMKLLAPDTGWVAGGNMLYWTTDNGGHWTNITPIPPGIRPESAALGNIFFLDTSEGWAVVSYQVEVPPPPPTPMGTWVCKKLSTKLRIRKTVVKAAVLERFHRWQLGGVTMWRRVGE